MVRQEPPHCGYYFALPRLWALLNGRDARRYECNWMEAYGGGVAVFVISYATLLTQFHAGVLIAIALLFVTWLAWLALFYLNSLVIDVLRHLGLCSALTNARAQNVIIGIETTGCAIALTMQPRWALLGWTWLLIVVANVAAAVVLVLVDRPDA